MSSDFWRRNSFLAKLRLPGRRLICLVLLATLSATVRAEYYAGFPADTPAIYRSECGSCHVAFPPGLLSNSWGLLSGDGWRRVMSDLPEHFGDKVEIEEAARREIREFLVRNAADSHHFDARAEAPRLTSTIWFMRMHGAVRPFDHDPRIGSLANCTVCHPSAELGRYEQLTHLARQIAQKR